MDLKLEIGGNDIGDAIVVGAAVVQAIGSVAAILAAYFLARHDRSETRRLQSSGRVSALAVIIFRSENLLREAWDRLEDQGLQGYFEVFSTEPWRERCRLRDRCLQALEAIPLHELEDWDLVSAVFEMIEALSTGFDALQEVQRLNAASRGFSEEFYKPDLSPLRGPVNLAAEASARVHNVAHRFSGNSEARKRRITANLV